MAGPALRMLRTDPAPTRGPGTTLATVADRVGFAHAFASSAAFKREHGISPSEHRTRETRAAT